MNRRHLSPLALLLGLIPLPSLAQPTAPTPAEVARLKAMSELNPKVQRDGEPWSMDPTSREEARQFYRAIYGASEGVPTEWNGDTAAGTPGTTSAAFKEAVRNRVNFYRAYAGVPANVSMNATFSAKAQEAAIMFSANNAISHGPPNSWTHYTADGAEAAGKSNIGIGTFGTTTMDGYMRDHGAGNDEVGHRRWILYPQTEEMGTGDVEAQGSFAPAQALWVQDAKIFDPRPTTRDNFVAWPPKGHVPYQLVWARWSFSLAGADFSSATVAMTRNGTPVDATVEARTGGGGAPEPTLVWLYDGKTGDDLASHDKPAGDVEYNVTLNNVNVGGSNQSFSYTVTVFDPAETGAGFTPTAISGSDAPGTGGTNTYSVAVPSFAGGFQWRALRENGSPSSYGAESGGLQGVQEDTSDGYTPRVTSPTATGGGAYHLAHPNPVTQTLTLPEDYLIVPGQTASLNFQSRLGWASAGQVARVQVSLNEGGGWSTIYEQAGSGGPGEGSYQTKTLSLDAFAGQTVSLRFVYDYESGTYFGQTDSEVGWLIDDIAVSGGQPFTVESLSNHTTGASFDYTPASTGRLALQARGMWFENYPMDWGPAFLAEATAGGGSGGGGGGGGGGSGGDSRIVNLSVRANAASGFDALSVGMVVGGSGTKPLLVRVVGPTLGSYGVDGTAPNPALKIIRDGATIHTNDDWSTSLIPLFNQLGAFALVDGSQDAAIDVTLSAAPHSVQVDTQGQNGVVVVEAYDQESPGSGSARLTNVSARNQVGTGADVLVAGFVIGGTGNKTLLIRGVGPTLANYGVPGALADPQLVVKPLGSDTVIASNDNWNNDSTIAAVASTVGAFELNSTADAALLVTLAPGAYTATISGVNNTTGIAVVEVYEVE